MSILNCLGDDMKKTILLILTVVLFLFPACSMKENDALVVCGTYAVPGFVVREMKGGTYTCTELERDSKGRILYEFSTESIISGEWETAIVICQSYNTNYVFFYEDKCYGLKNEASFSVDQLKLQNDWDKPLDYEKMSRREIVIAIPSYVMIQTELKINDVLIACQKKIKGERISIQEIQFVDSDGSGHELYYFTIEDKSKSYFALLSREYEVVLLEVSKPLDIPTYVAFKQQNGWVYGY